jgi:hypothetical protein
VHHDASGPHRRPYFRKRDPVASQPAWLLNRALQACPCMRVEQSDPVNGFAKWQHHHPVWRSNSQPPPQNGKGQRRALESEAGERIDTRSICRRPRPQCLLPPPPSLRHALPLNLFTTPQWQVNKATLRCMNGGGVVKRRLAFGLCVAAMSVSLLTLGPLSATALTLGVPSAAQGLPECDPESTRTVQPADRVLLGCRGEPEQEGETPPLTRSRGWLCDGARVRFSPHLPNRSVMVRIAGKEEPWSLSISTVGYIGLMPFADSIFQRAEFFYAHGPLTFNGRDCEPVQ